MPSFVFYGCPSLGGRGLHGELEGDFDGPGGGGGVEVGEAADVVDAHEFEDVFDADAVFHVGLVDHMMDHGICLEDDTVDIFRSNCIMPLGTSDSVIDWANHNFNKKVYFTGRLSYSRQLAVLSIVQLSHIDIRLKDEPL